MQLIMEERNKNNLVNSECESDDTIITCYPSERDQRQENSMSSQTLQRVAKPILVKGTKKMSGIRR